MTAPATGRAPDRPIHVLNLHSDMRVGGGQRHVLNHLTHLDDGFRHTVAYFVPPADMHDTFAAAGLNPVYLAHRGTGKGIRTLWRLVRFVRRNGVDVIHTNTRLDRLYGQAAGLLCGVPVVDTLRSTSAARLYGGGGNPIGRVRQWVERRLEARTVRHVIATSTATADLWRSTVAGTPLARIPVSTIYAGTPVERFTREDDPQLRASLGVGPADPVLLDVARLTHGKAQHLLVRLMERIAHRRPDVHLLLAGEGEARQDLEAQIATAGVGERVHLLGARDDVPALLGIADVMVFPSLREGMPVAVLEAMAAGRAIVAFDIPPCVEALRGIDGAPDRGVLVPLEDVDALTAAVESLLDDPARRAALGGAARDYARANLDVRVWAGRLGDIYAAACGRTRQPADA